MSKKSCPKWRDWEREVSREFGFKEVVASGSTDNFKGDCKGNKLLVDCKHTDKKVYSLTFDMWEKVTTWAINESRQPMLAVRTELGDYVVLPEHVNYEVTGKTYWDDFAKGQKSVSIGKQKRPMFYRLKDGSASLFIVVSPIDDVRNSIREYEALYEQGK